ncbi:MAG: hypothetical protein ACI8S3_001729, partial [Alphaproteobacteria bacterium]
RLVRHSPLHGDEANAIIMAARQIIYGDDVLTPEPEVVEGEGVEAEAEGGPDTSRSEADAFFNTPAGAGE